MRSPSLEILLCALYGLAAASCTGEEPPRAAARPNVILVTIDTLRADHCSLYGYARETTPHLSALAESAIVYEQALAPSSWTVPSMASLFTALPPRAHGVVNGTARQIDDSVIDHDILGDRFITLPEALREAGYATYGVSTNGHLSAGTGYAQGFDRLLESWWADAAVTNRRVDEIASELDGSRPFFLWVHYFDPHAPYHARAPWIDQYAPDGTGWKRFAGKLPREFESGAARAARTQNGARDLVDLYDSEINHVDRALAEMLSRVDPDGAALVVITSDHGESFLEHAKLGHGETLYEAEVRVPLVVRPPGGGPRMRIATPVSLLDVYATVVDAAGIPLPDGLAGSSLLAPSGVTKRRAAAPFVMALERRSYRHYAVRSGDFKLYRADAPSPFVHLYDLRNDPQERHDLAATRPERVAPLDRQIAAWFERWPRHTAERRERIMTDEELSRFRALGYVGD